MSNRTYLMGLWLCLASLWSWPARSHALEGLEPDHPRLLADDARFVAIRAMCSDDPLARDWYAGLLQKGEKMLREPVVRYHLRDGRRLLYECRDMNDRVLTLALLYRIKPDDRYLARIWADLDAAAGFPNWNPDHFLDVAEMALGFAIGYDWLYDDWTPSQRQTLRDAIIAHGLRPGLEAYDEGAWWTKTTINWNQVCNGGLITAALAIADEEPELAAEMITRSVAALPRSMERYKLDGGYDEGPGYWAYGTTYNALAIACLESALGHSFGLAQSEGFAATATFPIHLTGPTNMVFNFADGREPALASPTLFFLATRYGLPKCAQYAAAHNRGKALDLLWYDPSLLRIEAADLPMSVLYRKVGVAALRSAWGNPDAMYLAVKAGHMPSGHGQMDLGSFIFEDRGVRWMIDLGADDYNLPGYSDQRPDGLRWHYYRNRAEGHNTLVVNPGHVCDQRADASAPVRLEGSFVHVDLSAVYGLAAKRRFDFCPDKSFVEITDTLAADEPAKVWWFAHTRAQIHLADDGRAAILEQDGKRLRVQIESPALARFTVMSAKPLPTSPSPEGQNPNDGSEKLNTAPGSNHVIRGETPRYGAPDPAKATRKLAICLTDVRNTTLRVRLSPADE